MQMNEHFLSPKLALLFTTQNTSKHFGKSKLIQQISLSAEELIYSALLVDGGPGLVCVREGGSRGQEAAWCEVRRQTMNKCYVAVPSFGHRSDPAGWELAAWNGWRGTTKGHPACRSKPSGAGPAPKHALHPLPQTHSGARTRLSSRAG